MLTFILGRKHLKAKHQMVIFLSQIESNSKNVLENKAPYES